MQLQQDDIISYSKKQHDHLFALRQVFERCRNNGIYLNPKKSIFAVTEARILVFIVSKYGRIIDLERINVIGKIGILSLKKAMQYFLGKINFVRRFVPNFAQIVKTLQDLTKKENSFKWTDVQKDAFINIRKSIIDAPALMSSYFDKDFILYTFFH